MHSPVANAVCLPIRFSELANTPANAFASANGKWQRLFAIRFSEWQSRCIGLWPMQAFATGFAISLAKWPMHSPIIRPMPLKSADA